MTAAAAELRALLERRLGLSLADDSLPWLGEVLDQVCGRLGAREPRAALARLADDKDAFDAVVDEVVVNETFFFRNPQQLDLLADELLPALAARAGGPVRILSAACATGEEAYTLAMLAHERSVPVDIEAFDVSAVAIERARRGRYTRWSLRQVSDARRRHFVRVGDRWEVQPARRTHVRLSVRNLVDDDPAFWAEGRFDVVLCRNALMYLTRPATQRALENIARATALGGVLFLGHAESLRGYDVGFDVAHGAGAFFYRRTDARVRPGEAQPRVVTPPGRSDPAWFTAVHDATTRIAALHERSAQDVPAAPTRPQPTALEIAYEHVRNERYDDALASLDDATADNTDDILLLRAVLLTNLRPDEGAALCEAMLAASPDNAGAHALLGLCAERSRDAARAGEHYARACELEPTFAMPRVYLGMLRHRAGELAAAERDLERAVELLGADRTERIALFGGGFDRAALIQLCRGTLAAIRRAS